MPAYIRHSDDAEIAPVMCPACTGLLPMFVRDVEPHWSMAKIDFIYECSDCGAEVRQTIKKSSSTAGEPDRRADWAVGQARSLRHSARVSV